MKHESKNISKEQGQVTETQSQQTAARKFASAEEVLREEIRQTIVPPAIEQRLSKSIENLPKPEKSWWRRFIGD